CIFFFQAEDGIRDYKVTGVQTCALPILAQRKPKPSLSPVRRTRRALPNLEAPALERATVAEQKINQYRKRRYDAIHTGQEPKGRSEERRVGKECRSRWTA